MLYKKKDGGKKFTGKETQSEIDSEKTGRGMSSAKKMNLRGLGRLNTPVKKEH